MNVLKKELIGIGDLKLLMVLSLNLNLLECNILLILASCIGIISVIITKKKMIAFGPSIIYAYLIIKLVTK